MPLCQGGVAPLGYAVESNDVQCPDCMWAIIAQPFQEFCNALIESFGPFVRAVNETAKAMARSLEAIRLAVMPPTTPPASSATMGAHVDPD